MHQLKIFRHKVARHDSVNPFLGRNLSTTTVCFQCFNFLICGLTFSFGRIDYFPEDLSVPENETFSSSFTDCLRGLAWCSFALPLRLWGRPACSRSWWVQSIARLVQFSTTTTASAPYSPQQFVMGAADHRWVAGS